MLQEVKRSEPADINPRFEYWPGHLYNFQTAILSTNRQINKEAGHVLYSSNIFVSITHHYNVQPSLRHLTELFRKEGTKDVFEQRGYPILATGQAAREFKHYAMDVFPGKLPNVLDSPKLEKEWNNGKRKEWREVDVFMIACEDLQQLCMVILEINRCLYGASDISRTYTLLFIDVLDGGNQLRTGLKERLLEPFRRLHSIGYVSIAGEISEEYKSDIVASMRKEPPTAEDVIQTACATKAEGDKAFRNKNLMLSLSEYEKTYSDIEAGHQFAFAPALISNGKYAGLLFSRAKEHLLFTLCLNIIAVLLHLRAYQHAYNWGRVEQDTRKDLVSKTDFARLWHLRSQASQALGQSEAAYAELVHAVFLNPHDRDMAADLGSLTVNVLTSSAVTMKWTSSSRVWRYNSRDGAGQA